MRILIQKSDAVSNIDEIDMYLVLHDF